MGVSTRGLFEPATMMYFRVCSCQPTGVRNGSTRRALRTIGVVLLGRGRLRGGTPGCAEHGEDGLEEISGSLLGTRGPACRRRDPGPGLGGSGFRSLRRGNVLEPFLHGFRLCRFPGRGDTRSPQQIQKPPGSGGFLPGEALAAADALQGLGVNHDLAVGAHHRGQRTFSRFLDHDLRGSFES